jgi:hypothetical protein
MKRTALVASLALAFASTTFASTAFAQDQAMPASPASDQMSSTSSDTMNESSTSEQSTNPASQSSDDAQPMKPVHRMRHRRMHKEDAAEAATNGDDPKEAQYQKSGRMKSYPAVDHGHVAGDPPVIDHSGDQAPVANPTHTTIAVPPTH